MTDERQREGDKGRGQGHDRGDLPPPPRPARTRRAALLLGLGSALLVAAVWLAAFVGGPFGDLFGGLLDSMEELVMERHQRVRGTRAPHPDVVVVAVDAGSVDALGRWPWPRPCLATLVSRVADAGAEVIALDILFSEPAPGDDALAGALAGAANVVLGFAGRDRVETSFDVAAVRRRLPAGACPVPAAPDEDRVVRPYLPVTGGDYPVKTAVELEPNLDRFEEHAAAQGFFSHDRERGVQHRYDLVTRLDAPAGGAGPPQLYYPALALAAVGRFRGAEIRLEGEQGVVPVVRLGDEPVAADERLRLWIDYAGPDGTYPAVPAWRVLTTPPADLAAELKGKLVLIGVSEVGVGDVVATPFGDMAGVEVHANAAGNLLSGHQIRDAVVPQALLSLVAVFALALLVAWLVQRIGGRWQGAAAALACLAAWVLVVCHLAFRLLHWHLYAVPPLLAGLGALVVVLPYQLVVVESRARRIHGMFEHYLSPEYIRKLLEGEKPLKLKGETEDLTVLFCDIRGFTSLSEELQPEGVVDLLNSVFTPLTRAVQEEGGTLDKYMGDALMAFFGAPTAMEDHARRACAAALAMVDTMKILNRKRQADDEKPVHVGIGINSGEMTVGNMGSGQVFDYTVIGDAVNLGSRIEGLNKTYGTVLLVSELTRDAALRTEHRTEDGPAFLFRELDLVRVKGKEEPVGLHELMATAPASPDAEALAERFAAALALYRARDFAAAEERFAALAVTGDPPSALYVERCRHYRAEPPPEDWDGVATFTTK